MSEVSSFINGVRAGVDAGAPLATAMRDRRLHQMKLEMMEREWEHDREGWAWQSREKAFDREVDYDRLNIARGELQLREGQDARDATSQALDDKMKRWQLQRVKRDAARANVPPAMIGIEQTADMLAARRADAENRLQAAIAANDKHAARRTQAVLDTYTKMDAQFAQDPMGTSAALWGQGRTFDFTQKLPDGSTIKGKIPAGDAETLTASELIAHARAETQAPPAQLDPVAKGLQTQATAKLNELGTAKADLLMLQADGAAKVKPDAAGGYTKAGWFGGKPIATELDRINQQEGHLRSILGSAPNPMPQGPAAPAPAPPAQATPEEYFDRLQPTAPTLRPTQANDNADRLARPVATQTLRPSEANAGSTKTGPPKTPSPQYVQQVKDWLHDNMNSTDPKIKEKVRKWRHYLSGLAQQEAKSVE